VAGVLAGGRALTETGVLEVPAAVVGGALGHGGTRTDVPFKMNVTFGSGTREKSPFRGR
jgi:hypothetical protein